MGNIIRSLKVSIYVRAAEGFADSTVAREPIMEQTVQAAVSDWVTGIVFLRLAVSVKSNSNALTPPIHVMRRDDARLRKHLRQARVVSCRISPSSNWHNDAGIKLAEK
jgi:hypothetical protein